MATTVTRNPARTADRASRWTRGSCSKSFITNITTPGVWWVCPLIRASPARLRDPQFQLENHVDRRIEPQPEPVPLREPFKLPPVPLPVPVPNSPGNMPPEPFL